MQNPIKYIGNRITDYVAKRTIEAMKNPYNEAFLWAVGGGQTEYDPNGKTYIEEGYQINPFVYSMIKAQATKTASVPYYIRKIEDKNSYKKVLNLENATKGDYTIQQKVKKLLLENKAYSKDELEFPMERPNVSQTWTEWISLYKVFLKTTGNVYIYMLSPLEGANKGEPLQVYLLPSHLMQIVLKKGADMLGIENPIDYYMLVEGRGYIEFKIEDVIQIKYSNPDYGQNGEHLYGQSPLRAGIKLLESTNSSLDLNIKTLKSGGAFGFFYGKDTALTPEQATAFKQRLSEMQSSPEQLAKIAGSSVEMGFQRISLTSDELKPFDYLKFDEQQIANILEWSIEDENKGDFGGTIQEIKKTRITDNILPDLKLLAQALNEEFLPRFKGYENTVIEFDVSELPEMQTDIAKLVDWLDKSVANGTITRNEYRAAINYTESDDANLDKHTVNSDILTLDEALDESFNVDNGEKSYFEAKAGFDPNQPRDNDGKWGDDVGNGFDDLYGDLGVIELTEPPTFESIRSHFSETEEMEKQFTYKGRLIKAQRKFTYRGGGGGMFQIKTNYLHIWIQTNPLSSTMQHWKEDKNGDFIQQ